MVALRGPHWAYTLVVVDDCGLDYLGSSPSATESPAISVTMYGTFKPLSGHKPL